MPQRIHSRPKAIVESLLREDVFASPIALDRLDTLTATEWIDLLTSFNKVRATPAHDALLGLLGLLCAGVLLSPLVMYWGLMGFVGFAHIGVPVALAIRPLLRWLRILPRYVSHKIIQRAEDAVCRRIADISTPALAQAAVVLLKDSETHEAEEGKRVSPPVVGALYQTTLRLLPTITGPQAADWPLAHREAVYYLIRPRIRNWELVACALDAAGRWGDPKALSRVTTIVNANYVKVPDAIRVQAQQVRASLLSQYENLKRSETLLRPSQAAIADNLLRPAVSTPDRPDELLRSAQSAPSSQTLTL